VANASHTTSGPVVATTYRKRGGRKDYGHHVQETVDGDLVCVEHLVVDCHVCGRTPAEHDELAAKAGRDDHPHPASYGDCVAHTPRPACQCDLEKLAA
jgi:hypothetical protein